jgi:tetratricopeptide (TPR) repeat protein
MKTSNTLKSGLFLALIFFSLNESITAQNNKYVVSEAFSMSYASESKKNYQQAINDLMAVYDDKSYEINVRLGWLYYYLEAYELSKKYYEIAVQLNPNSVEGRLGLVLPASALANWDLVLQQYLEILKIDDLNSTVNYFTGLIFYNKSEFGNAEKYFEKVYQHYPFNYDTAIVLAITKQQLKKDNDAKNLFMKALLFYPGDQTALEGLKSLE